MGCVSFIEGLDVHLSSDGVIVAEASGPARGACRAFNKRPPTAVAVAAAFLPSAAFHLWQRGRPLVVTASRFGCEGDLMFVLGRRGALLAKRDGVRP